MKLDVAVADLRAALAVGLAKRGTLQILEHALLTVQPDGILSVTTSDLAQELTFDVAAQVEQPGAPIAARADLLKGALHALEGSVELSVVDQRLVLKQGRRRFNIPTLPGADFPRLQTGTRITLDVVPRELAIAIGRVAYCADKNNPRDYLNGVHLLAERVVATDGHRMAIAPLACGGLPAAGVLIPVGSVKLLRDCLANASDDDSVTLYGDEFLGLRTAGAQLLTKLAHGRAPDFNAIIHAVRDADVVAYLDVQDMDAALKRLHGFCAVDGVAAKTFYQLRLTIEHDAVEFAATQNAHACDVVAATALPLAESIFLNPNLLADTLACVHGAARCEWRAVDAQSVQWFSFDDRGDDHYIMPMRG